MRPLHYELLPDHSVKITEDLGLALIEDRRVGATQVGFLWVSTVFLSLDHAWEGRPLLFETMIFPDEMEYQERYSTWDEAVAGHKRAVRWAWFAWRWQWRGFMKWFGGKEWR